MNLKLHNALGWVGCLLIVGAMWAFHWALALGFVGALVVGCGVWMAKLGSNVSIEVRLKATEDKT